MDTLDQEPEKIRRYIDEQADTIRKALSDLKEDLEKFAVMVEENNKSKKKQGKRSARKPEAFMEGKLRLRKAVARSVRDKMSLLSAQAESIKRVLDRLEAAGDSV